MARARRQRDYKAEYARRVRGTAPKSPERQQKRGHRPPPGITEAAERRRRERERVREHGGTTSSERARIRSWFYGLARATGKTAEARGRDAPTEEEIDAGWRDFIRQWGTSRTWQEFERLRFSVAEKRLGAYRLLRAEGYEEAVEEDFLADLDEEFGLVLQETLWFILWRSGKPPQKGEGAQGIRMHG
jgi:hypothetical protein